MTREEVETDDGSGILGADSISCHLCDFCPGVHINFHDPEGDVFATAVVPVETGKVFMRQFRACMRESGTRVAAPRGRQ